MDYINYKIYFTNTFQNIKQIIEEVKNVDSVRNYFACSKCQMSVFHNPNAFQHHSHSCGGKIKDKQLTECRTEDIIDPYIQVVNKYLYFTLF
jgi:hypothetical protein